jgi:hypothetical protein
VSPVRPWGRHWLWVTLVSAFVAWNAVFDVIVNRGLAEYVDRHMLYDRGLGPNVTIRGVMDAAVSRGAWLATGAAAGILAAAAVIVSVVLYQPGAAGMFQMSAPPPLALLFALVVAVLAAGWFGFLRRAAAARWRWRTLP